MTQLTPAQIKEASKIEYKKCATDIVYFFKKYVYIAHPTRGKIKFNLYPFQEDILTDIMNNPYTLILKSRQLGISTLISACALHLMVFSKDKKILAIANKQDSAKNIVEKVKYAYDYLPEWMKPKFVENNKLSLRLANGSSIVAEASSPDAGRSSSASMVILDEAAFNDYIEDIWGSVQQTLSGGEGSRCIVFSTPNGHNWFYKQWMDAKNKVNKFVPIRLYWQMHPERDELWRAEQDIILGKKLAAQECDGDFLSSGNNVIDPAIVKHYRESFVKDPIEKRGSHQDLWIWDYPKNNASYLVCADVSRGDAEDFSAFHVIDILTVTQVAEFKSKIDTTSFGNLLVSIASEYNDALLVVENNTYGWATIQQIINRQYKNLYYSSGDEKYVDLSTQYTNKYNAEQKKSVPGFTTHPSTRQLLMVKLEEYFRYNSVYIHSDRTLSELDTFIWNGPKAVALKGYTDDLIMSLAIGLWIRDIALQRRDSMVTLSKAMLSSYTIQRSDNMPSNQGTGAADDIYKTWKYQFQCNAGEESDLREWL